jgi:hypothetical protein
MAVASRPALAPHEWLLETERPVIRRLALTRLLELLRWPSSWHYGLLPGLRALAEAGRLAEPEVVPAKRRLERLRRPLAAGRALVVVARRPRTVRRAQLGRRR